MLEPFNWSIFTMLSYNVPIKLHFGAIVCNLVLVYGFEAQAWASKS